jgi:hypothetical protein
MLSMVTEAQLVMWVVVAVLDIAGMFFLTVHFSKVYDDPDEQGDPMSCPHGHLDWDDCPDCGH